MWRMATIIMALGIVLTMPVAEAWPPATVARIGFLGNASALASPLVEAFRRGTWQGEPYDVFPTEPILEAAQELAKKP